VTHNKSDLEGLNFYVKAKKKYVFPVHAIKTHRGNRGIAPIVLNLGTRGSSVINFTPRLLYLREGTHYPLHRRLGGNHSRYGSFGKKINLFLLAGFEPWPV
jgi:hypothetical protein